MKRPLLYTNGYNFLIKALGLSLESSVVRLAHHVPFTPTWLELGAGGSAKSQAVFWWVIRHSLPPSVPPSCLAESVARIFSIIRQHDETRPPKLQIPTPPDLYIGGLLDRGMNLSSVSRQGGLLSQQSRSGCISQ